MAVATHLGGTIAAQAQSAFADGMRLALYITASMSPSPPSGIATLLREMDADQP